MKACERVRVEQVIKTAKEDTATGMEKQTRATIGKGLTGREASRHPEESLPERRRQVHGLGTTYHIQRVGREKEEPPKPHP
jgi:hypothetical protein